MNFLRKPPFWAWICGAFFLAGAGAWGAPAQAGLEPTSAGIVLMAEYGTQSHVDWEAVPDITVPSDVPEAAQGQVGEIPSEGPVISPSDGMPPDYDPGAGAGLDVQVLPGPVEGGYREGIPVEEALPMDPQSPAR